MPVWCFKWLCIIYRTVGDIFSNNIWFVVSMILYTSSRNSSIFRLKSPVRLRTRAKWPTHITNLSFQAFYNFTDVSEKNFRICQIERVDKVHKTLYQKCKWCTLLLVYTLENQDLAEALFGTPCGCVFSSSTSKEKDYFKKVIITPSSAG